MIDPLYMLSKDEYLNEVKVNNEIHIEDLLLMMRWLNDHKLFDEISVMKIQLNQDYFQVYQE